MRSDMSPHHYWTLPQVMLSILLCLLHCSLTSAEQRSNSSPIDYPCPKGCQCATLDMVTLDKVQVHCEVLNIGQDLLNFTVIQTDHTALLYLICNNIFYSSLFDSMFSHLTQLEELYFEECKITRLFPEALQGTEALRILRFRLSTEADPSLTIEAEAFKYTPDIEHVDVSGMGISHLPEDLFCGLRSLTHLNLSNNLLQEAGTLGYSTSTPYGQTCTPALTVLDLRGNNLQEINGPLHQHMPNLEVLYLQHNGLQRIGTRTFANLTKLAVLDLSYNRLTSMDPNMFSGLTALLILILQHNRLPCLPKNALSETPTLYQLNLADNYFTNECLPTLRHLSWLQILDISQNNLSHIDNTMFSSLYQLTDINLKNNNITAIEKCAFCDNYVLQQLRLTSNSLTFFSLTDIFNSSGPLHLQMLDLSSNRLNTADLRLNFSNLPSMTRLLLADNSLIEIPTGITQLKNLTVLDLHQNAIEEITEASFTSFPNLQYLVLNKNRISYIPKKVFRAMPHLTTIDLSRNTIHTLEYQCFDELPELLYILLNYNSIQEIDAVFYKLPALQLLLLDHNNLTQLTSQDMPSSITTLTLSHNSISKITGYFLKSMPNIKLIDLTFNKLSTISPLALQSSTNPTVYLAANYMFCTCRMQYLQDINDSPLSYAKVGDLRSILCYKLLPPQQHNFLVDLEPNDFLCEYSQTCPDHCSCCYSFAPCSCYDTCPSPCRCLNNLDGSYNRIECSATNLTSIPDNIPHSASHIFIDNNNVRVLDGQPFVNNTDTEYLYLNASGIEDIEPGTFLGLQNLRVLHLEDNDIKIIENGTFQGLANLEELHLQNNALLDIEAGGFIGLTSLKVLHLEQNLFEMVNLTVFDEVSPHLQEIYLAGNKWVCDCTFGPLFQEWLISVFQHIKDEPVCSKLEPGLTSNSSRNAVTQVNFGSCSNNTKEVFIDRPSKALIPTITVMLAVFLLTLISILLLFRYRDIIQVWLYSRYGIRISKVHEDEDKEYDAFISYSSKDETYIVRDLAPRLEEGDPPFRLCVHYRDWMIGRGIAESIISSVHSSRRTIMLLSNNYIESEWCNYEFQTAHHQLLKDKTCRLIVILMEDEPPGNLDDELKLYIKTHTYIRRSDPWFWERLKYALPSVQQEEKGVRWAAKAREKEMLERTKQALREFKIQGQGGMHSQGKEKKELSCV